MKHSDETIHEDSQGSMVQVLNDLQKEGYTESFAIRGGQVVAVSTKESFDPSEVTLKGSYRFEGSSDPDDLRVVYALKTSSNLKGTFVDAFGPYGDAEAGEVLKQIQDRREASHVMQTVPQKSPD